MENALGNPLLNKYTREEVAQHASRESCWVVVHDTVYDMTHYMDKHPGGFDLLFKVAGTCLAWRFSQTTYFFIDRRSAIPYRAHVYYCVITSPPSNDFLFG
jgi:cytochrome b involved in lipid metabolism